MIPQMHATCSFVIWISMVTDSWHCRGWCDLCCGRGFGLWLSPLKRYFEAFSVSNLPLPQFKINNAMNREAMQQATAFAPLLNVAIF